MVVNNYQKRNYLLGGRGDLSFDISFNKDFANSMSVMFDLAPQDFGTDVVCNVLNGDSIVW